MSLSRLVLVLCLLLPSASCLQEDPPDDVSVSSDTQASYRYNSYRYNSYRYNSYRYNSYRYNELESGETLITPAMLGSIVLDPTTNVATVPPHSALARELAFESSRNAFSYLASCGFAQGVRIDVTTAMPLLIPSEVAEAPPVVDDFQFFGGLGVVQEELGRGPCGESCQQKLTACFLASVNYFGVPVAIDIRMGAAGTAMLVPTPGFSLQEGAFMGNIFAPAGQKVTAACTGKALQAGELTADYYRAMNSKFQAPQSLVESGQPIPEGSEVGNLFTPPFSQTNAWQNNYLSKRICATGTCGMEYLGGCKNFENFMTSAPSCTATGFGGDSAGYFTGCTYPNAATVYLQPYEETSPPRWEVSWSNSLGGTEWSYDRATAVDHDVDGNVVAAGNIRQTATFEGTDTTLTYSSGKTDGWVAKYDASGEVMWLHQITEGMGMSAGAITISDVVATSDGGAVVVGTQGGRGFFLKAKKNGVIWAKKVGHYNGSYTAYRGGTSALRSIAAATVPLGGPLEEVYVMSGDFKKSAFFTYARSGVSSSMKYMYAPDTTTTDCMIAWVDSAGRLIRSEKATNVGGSCTGRGVDISASGEAVMVGEFTGSSLTLNSTHSVTNVPGGTSAHGFVAKYGIPTSRVVMWEAAFFGWASGDTVKPKSVAFDGNGNVFIGGDGKGSIILRGLNQSANVANTQGGANGGFLAKLNYSGYSQFVKPIGGSGNTTVVSAVDANGAGDVVVGGYSYAADFGAGSVSMHRQSQHRDGFVLRFNASGTALWGRNFGRGYGGAFVYDAAIRETGSIGVVGKYFGTMHVDTFDIHNMEAGLGYDGYVATFQAERQ